MTIFLQFLEEQQKSSILFVCLLDGDRERSDSFIVYLWLFVPAVGRQ